MASKPYADKGSYVMVALEDWTDSDFLRNALCEDFEREVATILRDPAHGFGKQLLAWGRAMAETIGGYQRWEEIDEYIAACLESPLEIPTDAKSKKVGTEADLLKILRMSKPLWDRKLDDQLAEARHRIELLAKYRMEFGRLESEHSRLFRKIYYAYKLREALLGQVGYYNGSLELRAGLTDDFEFWMYLIQMHLRRPDRQHLYPAPKAMATYKTPSASLLPWNNQFSFSMGHHEFDVGDMPRPAAGEVEKELIRLSRDEPRLLKLAKLMRWDIADKESAIHREVAAVRDFVRRKGLIDHGWRFSSGELQLETLGEQDPIFAGAVEGIERQFTIRAILAELGSDEVKRKALFTLILGITWSEELLRENPFDGHADAGTIAPGDIKDPRLDPNGEESGWARLQRARYTFNVIGRNSNVLVQPESARKTFEAKLNKLSEDERHDLYSNIDAVKAPLTVDQAVNQAVQASNKWMKSAFAARKPVYTGPSGHALTYVTLYARAYEQAKKKHKDAPSLHQARLVLLGALIGHNQHHSYDEVMTGSHGVEMADQVPLLYRDPKGYFDLFLWFEEIDNQIAKRFFRAAQGVARAALLQHERAIAPRGNGGPKEPPAFFASAEYAKTVRDWFETATRQKLGVRDSRFSPDEAPRKEKLLA